MRHRYHPGHPLHIDEDELALDYWARALVHHPHTDNLPARCLAVTMVVRRLEDCEKIKTVAYFKCKRVLNEMAYTTGPERSSLILAADVEGTRVHHGEFARPSCPHLHGVLVLSPHTFERLGDQMTEVAANLQINLLTIREVGVFSGRARMTDVEVKPAFDPKNWATYAIKAYPEAVQSHEDFPPPSAFPFDMDIGRGGDFADQLVAKMKALKPALRQKLLRLNN